jgi:hypothetical protein
MLKNAIESANYYPDSRERRNNSRRNSCVTCRLFQGICGASNYGRFSSRPTPLRHNFQLNALNGGEKGGRPEKPSPANVGVHCGIGSHTKIHESG